MINTQRFIYTHQAKLAWKQAKVGVGRFTTSRQGSETFTPPKHDMVLPGDYIETPLRHWASD